MSLTPNPTIGLLTWDYGRPKGGMGRASLHMVEALRQGGMNVCVLAPSAVDTSDDPLFSYTQSIGGHILFSLLLPLFLRRSIKKNHIGQLLVSAGPGGVLLLRRPPVPAVAIVHHSYVQQCQSVPDQRWKRLFVPFERRTLSFCQSIICFSDDTKHALVDGYMIDSEKITVIPHAIDLPAASSAPREAGLCVCVARLEERKGVSVILDAWTAIAKKFPLARLVIVGDGVQRTTIDRMIAELPRVERRSNLSKAELDALLLRASIAFCPAYLEGFGLACAEAMAAGCAVIASDVDGLRRLIVQGESGLLVPAGDSTAFAQATIGMLSDSNICQRFGSNARERIRRLCDPVRADAALCAAVRQRLPVGRFA